MTNDETRMRRDMAVTHTQLWMVSAFITYHAVMVEPHRTIWLAVSLLQMGINVMLAVGAHMALREKENGTGSEASQASGWGVWARRMTSPYRTSALAEYQDPPAMRLPDYDVPVDSKQACPKCGVETLSTHPSYGLSWVISSAVSAPVWCTGRWFWWLHLRELRRCPEVEHMHQSCDWCKARWTTGLVKGT